MTRRGWEEGVSDVRPLPYPELGNRNGAGLELEAHRTISLYEWGIWDGEGGRRGTTDTCIAFPVF
jgi:hypothetical protein